MNNKAIIFDMDGVIVTGDTARFNFLKKSYEKVGLTLDDSLFPKIIGVTFRDFLAVSDINPEKKTVLLEMFQKEYLDKITEHISPINLTIDFIKNYSGLKKLAIASNGFQKVNESIANKFGFYRQLSAIVSNESVGEPKPHPAVYLKTAEVLGMAPENCIAVEDSVVGAQAAINASMPCFVFLNSHNKKGDFSGMKIAGFIESADDLNKISTL